MLRITMPTGQLIDSDDAGADIAATLRALADIFEREVSIAPADNPYSEWRPETYRSGLAVAYLTNRGAR